jgi:hypothetical protein
MPSLQPNVICRGWHMILSYSKNIYPCILTSQLCTTFVFILVAAKKLLGDYMFEGFFFVTKIVVVFTNMDPNVRA